jgi:hypothetical protein
MATLPPFISWIGHGAASLAQPAVFSGATSCVFGIDTDMRATQALVDALLNPVGGSSVRYDVLAGVAMISFMTIARCTSQTDAIGWEPGRECALWVPLLETDHVRHTLRLVFWTPYIFIDYAIGMLTGREVWGWQKVWGRITVPSDSPTAPPAFRCATTLFETLAPTTQAQILPLLTVAGTGTAAAAPAMSWQTGLDAAQHVVASLLPEVDAQHLAALLAGPSIPTVQLKQFRDSLDPSRACFQAIVDSPAQLTGFSGGGLLNAADYNLSIATCESHQIVHDLLGVAPAAGQTTLPVTFAAWLAFDFAALPGAVVVSAV